MDRGPSTADRLDDFVACLADIVVALENAVRDANLVVAACAENPAMQRAARTAALATADHLRAAVDQLGCGTDAPIPGSSTQEWRQ